MKGFEKPSDSSPVVASENQLPNAEYPGNKSNVTLPRDTPLCVQANCPVEWLEPTKYWAWWHLDEKRYGFGRVSLCVKGYLTEGAAYEDCAGDDSQPWTLKTATLSDLLTDAKKFSRPGVVIEPTKEVIPR